MMQDFIYKNLGILALLGAVISLGSAVPVIHLSGRQALPSNDTLYLRMDPEKILLAAGDDRVPCGECHTREYEAWKSSDHATGFDNMHRSPVAQNILSRMDIPLAKRESVCLRCHYTATVEENQARAIAGVSCESCHGASRDWINVHNDYGGATHKTESTDHKQQRIEASIAGGMFRPSDNLYDLAANCFECHSVPSESVINTGRHPTGKRFELVTWMDKISHNFLHSQWGDKAGSRDSSPAQKRHLYVIGRLLDYEYSLRGAQVVTQTGHFSRAMTHRINTAARELEKIALLTPIGEISEVLRLHADVNPTAQTPSKLNLLAEKVRTLGRRLDGQTTLAGLQMLDVLIENGASHELERPSSMAYKASTPIAILTSQIPGEKRQRPLWFTDETYEVTAPGCNCHATASDWLIEDKHSQSAVALLNDSRTALEIASLYGLSPDEMKKGNQICMQCHGAIESGAEGWPVIEGVGCESCHGPGSGYFEPHKQGEGFQYGLRQLKNADVRAEICARCHLITDERLLAAGHASGQNFNIDARNNRINHWPDADLHLPHTPALATDALSTAYKQIRAGRPIPEVTVVTVDARELQLTNPRIRIDKSRGGWTIVVSSDDELAAAERSASHFARLLDGLTLPIEITTTGAFTEVRFRVCVGQFATREAALGFIEKTGSGLPGDAWVMRVE